MFKRPLGSAQRALTRVAGAAALTALLAAPIHGAGFSIYEQGSKAMGMAGAFTAQADDGSAIFYNVAGLGFQKEQSHSLGVTLINLIDSELTGFDPFPGDGFTAEQEQLTFFPLHYYYVRPLTEAVTFGFGVFTPFGLKTEWERETFPGRFLNIETELRTFDLTPSVGFQVSETFSVGVGAVIRVSDVSLDRNVPAINPFTQTVVDAANAKLESDIDTGFGFNVGILHKPNDLFSWGLMYRSEVEIEYSGDGVFSAIPTGNAQLDALLGGVFPFGQDLPIETEITFPDSAVLGLAFQVTDRVLVEGDVGWTGWSDFDTVFLDFPADPQFSSVLPQDWEDATFYRFGVAFDTRGGKQWRFGYAYDETPQPDEGVGPLLPDAHRNAYTIGWGGERLDIAFMWLPFKERETRTNRDNFNGRYETDAWLLGVTWRF